MLPDFAILFNKGFRKSSQKGHARWETMSMFAQSLAGDSFFTRFFPVQSLESPYLLESC
jgi:hypothetical protein